MFCLTLFLAYIWNMDVLLLSVLRINFIKKFIHTEQDYIIVRKNMTKGFVEIIPESGRN